MGRNTAFVDRFRFNIAYGLVVPLPQKPVYKDEASFGVPRPIPADTTVPVNDGIPWAFTQDQIDGIRAGKGRLSFYGYLKYSDLFWIFGARTTGYCFTYAPIDAQWSTCLEPDYTYAN
jgi:hypothetical protein